MQYIDAASLLEDRVLRLPDFTPNVQALIPYLHCASGLISIVRYECRLHVLEILLMKSA
ncbi:MAG: hypothetical protein QHG99_02410 [Methanomicrobiales archaeon]|nr:hypothetical protein [Methanomicrobiales archaeon]